VKPVIQKFVFGAVLDRIWSPSNEFVFDNKIHTSGSIIRQVES